MAACVVTWSVCYPFFGPAVSLEALVVPGLVFGPVLANWVLVFRHRGVKSLAPDWSWRRLAAPEAWLPALQVAVVAALGVPLVRRLGPVFLGMYAVLDALLALAWAIEGRKRILPVVIDPELSSRAESALREAGWEELAAFQLLDVRAGPLRGGRARHRGIHRSGASVGVRPYPARAAGP